MTWIHKRNKNKNLDKNFFTLCKDLNHLSTWNTKHLFAGKLALNKNKIIYICLVAALSKVDEFNSFT